MGGHTKVVLEEKPLEMYPGILNYNVSMSLDFFKIPRGQETLSKFDLIIKRR